MYLHGLYTVIEQNSTSLQTMLPVVMNSNGKFKEYYQYIEGGESKAGEYMIGLQASPRDSGLSRRKLHL